MADIFSNTNEPSNNEVNLTLNDLVGEGRKYSDPDQLANAYANSESFIERLKAENAELRAAKDIKDANNNNQPPPQGSGQEPPQGSDNNSPAPNSPPKDNVDFRSQIREEVNAFNDEQRSLTNLDTAAKRLVAVTGSDAKAQEALRNKATELGVTVDWLKETAMRSPAVFYKTMDIESDSRSNNTPAPRSEVRLDDRGNLKNFEFYDKIRKEDPKRYFSAALQSEMQKEARIQGGDFYKR